MTRVKSHILALMMMGMITMPAWGVGTVNQSLAQIPGSTNYVFTENWTADATTGSVPATVMAGTGQVQGFRIVSVEIAPGSPAPTNNYTVTITDFSGADVLGGAGANQSSTVAGILPSLANTPPLYGAFTVNVTGNVVNSAQGRILVYFAPVSQVIGNTPTGSSLTATNLFTGANTFSGTTTLSGPNVITGTDSGNQTITGNKTVTGVSTFTQLQGCQVVNASQTFAAALAAAASSGCIQVAPGTYPVSVNSTVPVGVTLSVQSGGLLSIANAATLTITGPFYAGNYQAFVYTGSGKAAFGDNTQPLLPTWFPGVDIGAQLNNTYGACPTQGCTIDLPGLSSGACYSFTTPILFNTAGKPVNLVGVNLNNTAGNVPGGSCLNYTPLTATTAITLDYINSVGAGYVPQGGMQNIILTNTTSYTNGGPAQAGGNGSLATGIATGTSNGGVGLASFNNSAIKGFHVGYLHQNSTAGAWGTQFVNTSFSYNDTGFQSTVQTEVLDFFGGVFGTNGAPLNLANTTAKFTAVHFDSNFLPSTFSGSTASNVNYVAPHFENLNVGASSCGANSAEYITSSGPSVNITGGDATDDCNTGTNTVYWFNLNGGSVNGTALTTAGRTPSTSVVIVNGETATTVKVILPTAGTSLRLIVTNSSGTQGTAEVNTHAANAFYQSTQYWVTSGQNVTSCTFTSGGGTSPSCAIDANNADSSGTLLLTTGSGAPAVTGTVTLNFGNQMGRNRVSCLWGGSLNGAGQWGSLAQFIDKTPGLSSDVMQWTNATGATPAGVALATSTQYQIEYWCTGR